MDAKEVNSVIEKLAEKLGMAAEQVAPLAEQVIREYRDKSIVGALGSGLCVVILGVITAAIARRSWKQHLLCVEDPRYDGGWVVAIIVSAIAFLIGGTAGAVQCVGHAMGAVAPTYYCLQALLK